MFDKMNLNKNVNTNSTSTMRLPKIKEKGRRGGFIVDKSLTHLIKIKLPKKLFGEPKNSQTIQKNQKSEKYFRKGMIPTKDPVKKFNQTENEIK